MGEMTLLGQRQETAVRQQGEIESAVFRLVYQSGSERRKERFSKPEHNAVRIK